MKRIITLIGVLASLFCFQHSASAQGTKNLYLYDSCTTTGNGIGGFFNYVSTTSLGTSCIVETNWGDASKMDSTTVFGSGLNYYATLPVHYYTVGGYYSIKVVLICSGTRIDSITKSYKVGCSYATGVLYNDLNSNCVYGVGELPIGSQAMIEVDSAGVVIDTVFAYGYWRYKFLAAATTVYKFTLMANPAGYVRTCPSSNTITYTYNPSVLTVPQLDFGFSCSSTASYDYKLSFWRALRGASSPGTSYIYLFAQNTTCNAGTGTVTLNVSPKYTISSISPTSGTISGNTVTWTLPNMSNTGGWAGLIVYLTPKSTTNNGDTACNYAVISPTSDLNPANNIISVCDSVKASWDPNDKSVSPAGPVAAGTKLTYTINFENLGNDTAFNIHVQDTLSQHLDANSFALVSSSHRVTPFIYQSGGQNILKLDFPNINLEDKNVPSRNKGQVVFTMNLKAGLTPGTTISNRGGIYFDGNPVVLTNYAHSNIPSPSGIPGRGGKEDIKVYPNPAGSVLNIQVGTNGWEEAVLSNALGQVVLQQQLSKGGNELYVEHVPTGVYYLQVKGAAGSVSEKIEKR